MSRQSDIFAAGAQRLQMTESIELTIQSMQAYGADHEHWAVAWSGGKDSTTTLTLLIWLIDTGRVKAPKTLTVFYADTRQELPPLAIAAHQIMDELRDRGIRVEVVCAPLDKRFMVYILGRGVPPPNNNTLRWCTRQIKIDPMQAALEQRLAALDGNVLMITGVRQGESAIRDKRIEMSCGKDGAECGQGWYQKVLPEAKGLKGRLATLAPLLHWRVCHVWEWLKHWAPLAEFGDWSTAMIADAYGGDEAEEINARTGCTGCPLASEEKALETVLAMPHWAYLAPLRGLKELWRQLREPQHRLRKAGIERLLEMCGIAVLAPSRGHRRRDGKFVDFPEFHLRYWLQHLSGPQLFDWNPAERCHVPIVVPDVPAGVPAPLRLTEWKEGALKVIATLRRQGFITTKQIAECGVSATNWTRSWLDKGAERGTWVESPRMPAFDQQHPEAFTKIQQALDKSAQPTLFT
ncbi:TPA: phosphoadenosine phosphosulfate reductase family protein [Pseudomonas aeruginosa]